MSDEVWRRNEIESPCQKICILHRETRLCIGCNRTGDEIARWSRMSADERRVIIDELPTRVAGGQVRRGGRQARLKRPRNTT